MMPVALHRFLLALIWLASSIHSFVNPVGRFGQTRPSLLRYQPSKNEGGADADAEADIPPVDHVLQIPILEEQLKKLNDSTSNKQDNQETKKELKEKLHQARSLAELGVRATQVQFYSAFSENNIKLMASVWSEDDQSKISCIHPGMPSIEGRDDILDSWKQIFDANVDSGFNIQPADGPKISICGTTAMCSCIEEIRIVNDDDVDDYDDDDDDDDDDDEQQQSSPAQLMEALNVYKREDGKWRMTMHMANPILYENFRG